jgi:hypothetical protein
VEEIATETFPKLIEEKSERTFGKAIEQVARHYVARREGQQVE